MFSPAEIEAVRAVMPRASDMTIQRHLQQRVAIVEQQTRPVRIGITLEPPRYGMTGPECGVQQQLRLGYVHDDAQALDAPEYIARGSVRTGHQIINGTFYASTTDAMGARMHGV